MRAGQDKRRERAPQSLMIAMKLLSRAWNEHMYRNSKILVLSEAKSCVIFLELPGYL